jgi:hypothetical protein
MSGFFFVSIMNNNLENENNKLLQKYSHQLETSITVSRKEDYFVIVEVSSNGTV